MMPHLFRQAQGARTHGLTRGPHGTYPPRVLVILLVSMALLLSGCAGTHGKGREVPIPMSDQHERIIGGRLATRFETDIRPESDPIVNDYVSQLGQHIAQLSDRPEIPYAFRVFADLDPKAMAFPGGLIYLSTGLLKQVDNECQLAGVLAHEIAHVAAHNPSGVLERDMDDAELAAIARGARGASRGVDSTAAGAKGLALLAVGYGQDVERQADRTALLYVSRAGLNPDGMIEVMEKIRRPSSQKETFWEPLAGGHPSTAQRVALLREELKSLGLDAGLPRDPRPYASIKNRLR
jgi:predicted Zn-dependent protease